MDWETAKPQQGLYLDRVLPPEDRAALDDHLAVCPQCAKELAEMTDVISALVPPAQSREPAPKKLWAAIETRLDRIDRERRLWMPIRLLKRPPAMAASVLFVIVAGILGLSGVGGGAEAAAAPIDYGVLLDALPLDPGRAFARFLTRYGARRITPIQAKRYADGLNFELPEDLPCGFHLEEVFAMRFGGHPGIAARYARNGELLGAIFHPPVEREHFGTHKDYPCVIGRHRGHQVAVGDWKLVHLTDPTTCHCVLSRLDEATELPLVMDKLAPALPAAGGHTTGHDHGHGPGE